MLKNCIFALCLAAAAAVTGARAQVSPETIELIRTAVDGADVDAILAHSGERLEVGLFGAARLYSRSQAGHVLRGFFRENPPGPLVIDEVAATETAWYASAVYHRPAGQAPLRLYLRLRLNRGVWLLREFVILRPER